MGEIILKFNTFEESEDARTALDGYKWKHSMWELDQWLRSEIKYNEKTSAETDKAYQAVRDKMRALLVESNLNLES